MLDPDMVFENLFAEDADEEAREQCDLAWLCMGPHDRVVALNAAFILNVQPIANTMMRDAYDRMSIHTRATLAMRALSAALDFDQKTRARVTFQAQKLRAELEQTADVWQRASDYADVLIGDRA